jgi:predicted Rossmann fold nucleotide-binding protein DprA/Smf involved in DNA uptake
LREGALLAEDPIDVLSELGLLAAGPAAEPRAATPLFATLRGDTLTANDLAVRLGRTLPDVLVELVEHELRGDVVRAPGGLWRLAQRGDR